MLISVRPLFLFTSGATLEFIIIELHYFSITWFYINFIFMIVFIILNLYRLTPISTRLQLHVIGWIHDTSRKRPSKPVYISFIVPMLNKYLYTCLSIFFESDPLWLMKLTPKLYYLGLIWSMKTFKRCLFSRIL